mmetsp:Transcript_104701/g.312737  ORF Transcript_104701/g.312737 Transcript_104701/m.312737 type:complete len:210 (-) Transcript_104701:22-651(-)
MPTQEPGTPASCAMSSRRRSMSCSNTRCSCPYACLAETCRSTSGCGCPVSLCRSSATCTCITSAAASSVDSKPSKTERPQRSLEHRPPSQMRPGTRGTAKSVSSNFRRSSVRSSGRRHSRTSCSAGLGSCISAERRRSFSPACSWLWLSGQRAASACANSHSGSPAQRSQAAVSMHADAQAFSACSASSPASSARSATEPQKGGQPPPV